MEASHKAAARADKAVRADDDLTQATAGGSGEPISWPGAGVFRCLIEAAAEEAGGEVQWVADGWIASLRKGDRSCRLVGSYFPLNDSAAAHLAEDKVATYIVLRQAGVPAVQHEMIPYFIAHDGQRIDELISRVGLPVVIKPATGKGGVDVHKADTPRAARSLVRGLLERYRSLAVSPFEDITAEYRVVVLDDVPLLIYKKLTGKTEWRHNIRLGARPVLEESAAIRAEVAELAKTTMRAIGGRFMSVDIIATPGHYKVLEVNAGVMLNGFAAVDTAYRDMAVAVYREALTTCLDGTAGWR